mgnify:FL=1
MSSSVKKIVIDALKPRDTPVLNLAKALCDISGIDEVDLTVVEVDAKTETVKLTLHGNNVDYDNISKVISDHSSTIRSIDEINVSKLG